MQYQPLYALYTVHLDRSVIPRTLSPHDALPIYDTALLPVATFQYDNRLEVTVGLASRSEKGSGIGYH